MIVGKKYPCRDCAERTEDCHSKCEAYNREKLIDELVNAQRRRKYDEDARATITRIEGAERISRSGKKPKER